MIAPLLIFRLTVMLATAALSLALCRSLEARFRSWLCTAAVLLALALPLVGLLGAIVEVPLPAVFTFGVLAGAPSSVTLRIPWYPIWQTGVLLLSFRYAAGLFYLAWHTRRATPYHVADPAIGLELRAVNASIRLAPVPAPLVWGWLKPVILLPEEAGGWSPESVRLALVHELAHVCRHDLWVSLLWMSAKAVYWFHPLVWWLSLRAREEQELACDARVLAAGASPAQYAGLLIDIARHVQSSAACGCAMVTHPNLLRGRVMHILQSRPRSSSAKGLVSFFLSLGLIASAGFIAFGEDHPAASDQHVYKIGAGVSAPRVLSKVEPNYSAFAKDKKIMGNVLLYVVIDQSGLPKNIRVTRSLDTGLDANAIDAVKQWRFAPAKKDGKAVACEANIEVNFKLK